eukprot:1158084-Pelagomonas_calceolata.AAC.3
MITPQLNCTVPTSPVTTKVGPTPKPTPTCCQGRGMDRTLAAHATSSSPRLAGPTTTPAVPGPGSEAPAAASPLFSPCQRSGGSCLGARGCLQWTNAASRQPKASTKGKGGRGASSSSAAGCSSALGAGAPEADAVGGAAVEGVAWVCTAWSRVGATCRFVECVCTQA